MHDTCAGFAGRLKRGPNERFSAHVERFNELADRAQAGTFDEASAARAAELYERDKLFPDIDYRWFKAASR